MNSSQQPPLAGFKQGLPGTDLFLRDEDSTLCDSFCERIVSDGMNLSIICPNRAVVDHYCSLLVKRLRGFPEVRLQVYSATNSEELLNGFNLILESMSTSEATNGRSLSVPLRVLVASEADTMAPVLGRLLARLVSNFPGANTQLILLRTAWTQQEPMTLLGNRLLHWQIPAPTLHEARHMLEQARHNGLESEAINLLKKIDPALLQPSEKQSDATEDSVITNSSVQIFDLDDAKEDQQLKPKQLAVRSPLLKVLLAGVMMIASASVVLPLFPKQTDVIRSMIFSQSPPQTDNPTYPPETSPLSLPQKTSSEPNSSNDAVSSPTERSEANQGGETAIHKSDNAEASGASAMGSKLPQPAQPSDAQPGAAAEKAPATPPTNSPSIASAPPSAAKSISPNLRYFPDREVQSQLSKTASTSTAQKQQEKPSVTRSEQSPVQELRTRTGPSVTPPRQQQSQAQAAPEQVDAIRAVRTTPRRHFFVQHVALGSIADAQDWRGANPPLSKSLVIPIVARPPETIVYAVVSGPFPTRKEALAFAKVKGVPTEHWLRSAASLSDALAPTN